MSSRTSRGRASHINWQGQGSSVSGSGDSEYGRIGQMEPSPGGEQRPTTRNVASWNDYVATSRTLQQLQDAAINNNSAKYSRDLMYIEWDRRQDLQRARAMKAQLQDYRNNQTSCNGGNQVACNAVGRRNPNDAQYVNPSQSNFQNFHIYSNRENPNPPPPAEPVPGDIMGDGTTETPAEAPTPKQVCENGGGIYDSDRGVCFHQAPAVPNPPSSEPEPDSEVHTDEPEERTGEQVPDCPQGGRRNLLGILDSNCHDRMVNPTAQGGGSHSGKSGSKTMAGSDEVIHFDTGGKNKTLSRQENPVLQVLNLMRGLKDPYGEFRKCKTEKRIVE